MARNATALVTAHPSPTGGLGDILAKTIGHPTRNIGGVPVEVLRIVAVFHSNPCVSERSRNHG